MLLQLIFVFGSTFVFHAKEWLAGQVLIVTTETELIGKEYLVLFHVPAKDFPRHPAVFQLAGNVLSK